MFINLLTAIIRLYNLILCQGRVGSDPSGTYNVVPAENALLSQDSGNYWLDKAFDERKATVHMYLCLIHRYLDAFAVHTNYPGISVRRSFICCRSLEIHGNVVKTVSGG